MLQLTLRVSKSRYFFYLIARSRFMKWGPSEWLPCLPSLIFIMFHLSNIPVVLRYEEKYKKNPMQIGAFFVLKGLTFPVSSWVHYVKIVLESKGAAGRMTLFPWLLLLELSAHYTACVCWTLLACSGSPFPYWPFLSLAAGGWLWWLVSHLLSLSSSPSFLEQREPSLVSYGVAAVPENDLKVCLSSCQTLWGNVYILMLLWSSCLGNA